MIEIVTFTGVDERTDLTRVARIAEEYPFAEFGILIGSQTGGSNPIFPSLKVVNKLKHALPPDRIALHLCGKYARQAVGYGIPTEEFYDTCRHFDRIQVNLHADADDLGEVLILPGCLMGFAMSPWVKKVILQHRGDWKSIPIEMDTSKLEYLFDVSEGRGIESFKDWPAPPEDKQRVGYAGGIGPDNIQTALNFGVLWPEYPMWIDMESKIRTDFCFDLGKVRQVCEKVSIHTA